MQPGALIILGTALVVGAALVILTRRGPSTRSGRPGLFAREEEEHAGSQLSRLLVDIQELSREQIARLDTKIRMLQQLVIDADKRIAELKTVAGTPSKPARAANPLHDRVFALADAGKSVDDICTEAGLERGEVELILGLRRVG